MNRSTYWITIKCLLIACLFPFASFAQHFPGGPPVKVGECRDYITQRVYEVDSNLWMRNIYNHAEQYHARRDPSGMTFMLLPSGIPTSRFWVTWDMRLIRIEANGSWFQQGDCQLHPNFVNPHRPVPVVQPNVDYNAVRLEHAPSNLTQEVKIPDGFIEEDVEFLAPIKANQAVAGNCMTTSGGNRNKFFDCVARESMGAKERAAYDCMRSAGTNKQELSLCMLKTNMGSNERAALASVENCARTHGNNWGQYPVCLSAGQFDDKTRRAIDCAQKNMTTGNPNYWGMASCYAGPQILGGLKPNAEAAMAIECAMASGGEPSTFVSCTSGQLIASELNKCLTHGVGGNGCFGEGNTITKAYDDVGKKIADAFGKNSVAYDAWRVYAATTNPADAAKALNNIAREGSQAAKNVAREAQKVIPRIKVKRIKIKW